MAMSQLVGNAAETPETHMAKFRRNLYLHFLSVNRGKFGSENVTMVHLVSTYTIIYYKVGRRSIDRAARAPQPSTGQQMG